MTEKHKQNVVVVVTACGKTKSNNRKLFTTESKKDHENNCLKCIEIQGGKVFNDNDGRPYRIMHPTDFDDVSDGVYWSLPSYVR